MKKDFDKLCLTCKNKYISSNRYVTCNIHLQLTGEGDCNAYKKDDGIKVKVKKSQSL